MNTVERKRVIISGRVQGVGFRPFLWHQADSLELAGFCRNTSAGVLLEIQGKRETVTFFLQNLQNNPPPLAKITGIEISDIPPVSDQNDFRIMESVAHAGQNILVAPDIATCADCAAEIRDYANRRHDYAFTNCVNCGPRFSITSRLPYDRVNTVMSCFKLCSSCQTEFQDPADRRFHAQPIACPVCGPLLWHVRSNQPGKSFKTPENAQFAIKRGCETLIAGGILALKGLGGFQLACNAHDEKAVARLRHLKNRPHKAFAVMVDSLETAARFVILTPLQEKLLAGCEKPIVLCKKKDNPALLATTIAPDVPTLGIMLPYTPLHILLFGQLKAMGISSPCLVMTSGNAASEPICLRNREALTKLAAMCDSFLLHNRDILVRVDDSVVYTTTDPWQKEKGKETPEQTRFIRRARGYVPAPVESPFYSKDSILGMGAELKATFTLTRGSECFSSQHIGDLAAPANLDFYQDALKHLETLLAVSPRAIVTDLHPDFLSTQLGKELGKQMNIPVVELQHHAAHASAVLAENGFVENALAICLDGSGLGADGTVWGGEFIRINLAKTEWERVGTFKNFPLPGGEKAIMEPWRIARGLDNAYMPHIPNVSEKFLRNIDEALEKHINIPKTSSCGRLFDAVAARLGLCEQISYEGQAAIRLEHAAIKWLEQHTSDKLPKIEICFKKEKNLWQLDVLNVFRSVVGIFMQSGDAGLAAAAFHWNLADVISKMALAIAEELNISHIAFTGGVMLNQLLSGRMLSAVRSGGATPLQHIQLPCGDASISYGQAIWGQAILRSGKLANDNNALL